MEKSNIYFNTFIKILSEDSIAGDGGAFGELQPTATTFSGANYGDDDARNIFGGLPNKIQRRAGISTKKRKKRKKTRKSRKNR